MKKTWQMWIEPDDGDYHAIGKLRRFLHVFDCVDRTRPDNRAFYKSCGRIVYDLVEENHFVSNIAQRTNAFLNEWFPTIIAKII
jgi:hypothetical protein